MTQERMNPEDRRSLMAASLLCSLPTYSELSVTNALEATDRLLAELARTAKPEAREPLPGEIDAHISGEALDAMTERAEKAEARVKELESHISVLVHGERNNDLVFALWNETCGGASADKAAADLRSMIANLENNLDNSRARVKELEDAIGFHQSSLVAGFEVDRQLWLKVK